MIKSVQYTVHQWSTSGKNTSAGPERMNAGGDTDKVARLDEPEVLLAMQKKYGIE